MEKVTGHNRRGVRYAKRRERAPESSGQECQVGNNRIEIAADMNEMQTDVNGMG